MEKYKDSDVELMSILLKLQEQTSPIRMSITFEGGIYQDRDIKPMDIGSVG